MFDIRGAVKRCSRGAVALRKKRPSSGARGESHEGGKCFAKATWWCGLDLGCDAPYINYLAPHAYRASVT